MASPRKRTHAWLSKTKGPPGPPFLPNVGDMYLVTPVIYSLGNDPAGDRRAVVISIPSTDTSFAPIWIVTRTTQKARGVQHPADLSLNCDRDGVFSDLRQVERQLWKPENVEFLGVLPDPFLTAVLERFA